MTRRAAALGAASGALYWLGLPGHAGWGCAVLAFAPLAVAARRGVRDGALAGSAMGLTASALALSFVPGALGARAGLGAALAGGAYVALVALTAAPFAALGAAAAWLARRGAPLALSLGLLHAVVEAHAPRVLTWSLAASLLDAPLVSSTVDVIGARLVGAAAVALGASVGAAASARRVRGLLAPALLVTAAWMLTRARGAPDAGAELVVAAVQPGGASGPPAARDQQRWARHAALSADAAARGATLIVGAEGLVPGVVGVDVAEAAGRALPSTSLVGAVIDDGDGVRNTALALDDGRVAGRHDKRWLVPLSERAPRWLARWLGQTALTPGARASAVETRAGRLGVGICYEEMVDGALDAAVLDGAEVLATLSHDEWFDGTDVPERQLAHARLRAMEHGRWLVRASTTGPSAVIDPRGRVVATAPRGPAAVVVATARRRALAPPALTRRAWWLAAPWLGLALSVGIGEYLRRRSVQACGQRAEKLTVWQPRGTHPSRFREGADPGEAPGGRS